MSVPEFIIRYLNGKGVQFSIRQHERSDFSSTFDEASAESELAKSVVCLVSGRPIILVVAAPCHVDLATLRREIKNDFASFAKPQEEAIIFPDCDHRVPPPPLRLWEHVDIIADTSLYISEEIEFPVSDEASIRMNKIAWLNITHPSVASFASFTLPANLRDYRKSGPSSELSAT